MSIRPVDMQVSIHKSMEVGRINRNESGHKEVAQQQFAEKMQKETKNQDHYVATTDKSESQNVNKDGRSGNFFEKRKKEKNKDGKNDKSNSSSDKSGSMFDVKI